jgi:hypothetical protein
LRGELTTLQSTARVVCRYLTNDCVMDTNPERERCNGENCAIVRTIQAMERAPNHDLTIAPAAITDS